MTRRSLGGLLLCFPLWLGACDDSTEGAAVPPDPDPTEPVEPEPVEPEGPLVVSTESEVARHARVTFEGARVTRSLASMAPAVFADFRIHNDGERDLRIAGIRADGTAVFVDANGFRLPIFGGNDELDVPAGGSATCSISFDADTMEGATVRFWGVAYPLPGDTTQPEG